MSDPDKSEIKKHWLDESPKLKNESITFILFLSIAANFILGAVITYPLYNQGKVISPNISNVLFTIYFLINYMLLLALLSHYTSVFKIFYKHNEIRFLVIALGFGLLVASIASFKLIGIPNTLSWLVPTIVTIVLFYIGIKLSKNKGSLLNQP